MTQLDLLAILSLFRKQATKVWKVFNEKGFSNFVLRNKQVRKWCATNTTTP